MKVQKKIIILTLILSVLVFLNGCNDPVCGNGELEEDEDSSTCCLDAGCPGEQKCVENKCQDPECGECQYVEDHKCVDYECCKDSECSADEECSEHECEKITCDECEYLEDRECKKLKCCDDEDCDDNDSDTIDLCQFPGTKSANCIYESVNECEKDSDCDDGYDSTEDTCSVGKPRACRNLPITDCEDDDNYCPEDCNYRNDNDCEETEIECDKDDLTCFTDALKDCLLADLTWEKDYENDSVEMDITTYLRIKDENSDDECEVFFRTEEIQLELTNSHRDYLQTEMEYSESEVDDIEKEWEDDEQNHEGDNWTCYFDNTGDLIDILNDWDDGDYDLTDLEDDYSCEGDNFD